MTFCLFPLTFTSHTQPVAISGTINVPLHTPRPVTVTKVVSFDGNVFVLGSAHDQNDCQPPTNDCTTVASPGLVAPPTLLARSAEIGVRDERMSQAERSAAFGVGVRKRERLSVKR